jgi:hypothetical protein
MMRVKSANHSDSGVILVFIQKFLAEKKETSVRKTIVFENDPLLFLGKEPPDRPRDRMHTADIDITEQSLYFTLPVYMGSNETSYSFSGIFFTRDMSAGSIRSDIKPGRLCTSDSSENFLSRFDPVKYYKQNRGF